MQLLVQFTGEFLYVIWILVTRTYPKFVTQRSFFKNVKEVKNSNMGSEKSVHSFKIKKKKGLPD